jgi:hypothetical protein
MLGSASFDMERPAEAMNHDMTGRAMLGQTTAGFEREQQEPQRPPMDQASLSVPIFGWVRLDPERAGKIWKVEWHGSPGQSVARMRAKPLVRLIHGRPHSRTCGEHRAGAAWHRERLDGLMDTNTADVAGY